MKESLQEALSAFNTAKGTFVSSEISRTDNTCFVLLSLLSGLLWCSLCFAADLASDSLAWRGSAAQPQTVP